MDFAPGEDDDDNDDDNDAEAGTATPRSRVSTFKSPDPKDHVSENGSLVSSGRGSHVSQGSRNYSFGEEDEEANLMDPMYSSTSYDNQVTIMNNKP